MKTAFLMGAAAGFVLGACLIRKCRVAEDIMQTAEDTLCDTIRTCKQKMHESKANKQAQEEYAQMYDDLDGSTSDAQEEDYSCPYEDFGAVQNNAQQTDMTDML